MTSEVLHVYHNDNDSVVAHSHDDAMAVWSKYVGDDWEGDGYGTADDWVQVASDDVIKIAQEDEPRPPHIPEGATVTHPDFWLIETSAQQWADYNGRGWLCSYDW